MTAARPGERGVTLAVVAAVMIVLGGMVVLGNALQHMREERQGKLTTSERLDRVTDALVAFAMVHKRLPCPADGAMPMGVEVTEPDGCGDQVRGTVPWRSLGVPEAIARDRWGRKISYRVAGEAGTLVDIDSAAGLTVCGDAACDLLLYAPESGTGAAFVLISHGATGHGGFVSGSGQRVADTPRSANERANLSAGGPFVDRPPRGSSTNPTTADFFDDTVRAMRLSDLLVTLRLKPISAGSPAETNGG